MVTKTGDQTFGQSPIAYCPARLHPPDARTIATTPPGRHLAAVIRLAQFREQTKSSPQSMTEEELELAIGALAGGTAG